ncbi:hypothetical protein FB451DRAFT_1187442 [Mycena latifolia]|nr:hypothetical protein FB451DRAFT_1187442 [Mycena latifolia]
MDGPARIFGAMLDSRGTYFLAQAVVEPPTAEARATKPKAKAVIKPKAQPVNAPVVKMPAVKAPPPAKKPLVVKPPLTAKPVTKRPTAPTKPTINCNSFREAKLPTVKPPVKKPPTTKPPASKPPVSKPLTGSKPSTAVKTPVTPELGISHRSPAHFGLQQFV